MRPRGTHFSQTTALPRNCRNGTPLAQLLNCTKCPQRDPILPQLLVNQSRKYCKPIQEIYCKMSFRNYLLSNYPKTPMKADHTDMTNILLIQN